MSTRRERWALTEAVTFLNHGSYGACPRAVLAEQDRLRARLEAEPVRFMRRELEPLFDAARASVAAFVGAQPEDLAAVTNATTGVNAVLSSLPFEPGDELLTTSHVYNACRNTLEAVARRAGAKVVVAEVPWLLRDAAEVTTAVLGAVTSKTRLALVDHVTSPSALIFPVEALVPALEARGVMVLVDGAHAPGMVPLSLDRLGASFYVGNLHKWVCAPKSAGFLHVRRDRQAAIHPTVTSHGANSPRTDRSRFQLEFDWVGTVDPTPFLCVPKALEVVAEDGGWPQVMAANREGALQARWLLNEALEAPELAPEAMLGSMATVLLEGEHPTLQDRLLEAWQIEVPIIPFAGRWLVRVSVHRHVRPGDVPRLRDALCALARNSPRSA